jgi:hypothetical protein
MHNIVDEDGRPRLLFIGIGGWVDICYDEPGMWWQRDHGFAFTKTKP